MLKLYNSLTREKQEFKSLKKDSVSMYVCGPTVYDQPHIGNARAVVVYDVLYRLLKHLYQEPEHKVKYVRNITDVDDKIIKAAKDNGESIAALTKRITDGFHTDMKALNCLEPDKEPTATAHISDMIKMIEKLIKNKNAYVKDGHVLFDVFSLPTINRSPLEGEQLRGLQQKASKRGGASGGNEMPPHDSLRSSTPPPGGSGNHLIQKYLIPQPRVELGRGLVGVANAAIDVSDGLLADLNHICKNSGVGASIHQEKIPVFNDKYFELAVTGGDDYELLFTAPQSARQKVQKLAKQSKTKVALIGSITRKKDLQILGRHGKPLTFKRLGYKHF